MNLWQCKFVLTSSISASSLCNMKYKDNSSWPFCTQKVQVFVNLIVKYFKWKWKFVFYGSFMIFLSCFYYTFKGVCLLMSCGHLLGKGWPLDSCLLCLMWSCHFPIGILGQVWCLIVLIPDLCPFSYLLYLSTRQLLFLKEIRYNSIIPWDVLQENCQLQALVYY